MPANAASGRSSFSANQTTSFFLVSGFGSGAYTPIWKLEAALKCRSCRKGRYAPPVHMIKLTETREITPYRWVHPDEER
jgi:hypothetical protein